MAPSTRNNAALAERISTLQLRLAPFVPLPEGPPHPDFPKTLMAFHLLTEDQLDSIAHYYHQSTPHRYTHHYPATMNWDKDLLAKPRTASPTSAASAADGGTRPRRRSRALSHDEARWLDDLMKTVAELQQAPPLAPGPEHAGPGGSRNPYANLSDTERIRIKRRKVGKFIGLVGMETPLEEIAGCVQATIDRAIDRSREELRRNEEGTLRRRKMA